MTPSRHDIVHRIRETRVVAIVRLNDSAELGRVADAIRAGGLDIIEFTMTTPSALEIIAEIAGTSDVLLGAGSVLDSETARAAILAGAQFIVSPSTDAGVIETAHRYGKAVIPGAYTPTEIVRAMELGADFIKVFPVNTLGPGYLKAVKAPLPQADLVPTGGITLDNAAAYFEAGAAAIAIGGELVNNQQVQAGDFAAITQSARKFGAIAAR